MLKIYTDRIGRPGLDITVKSGDQVFAPTWDIVMGLKHGDITWEQYVEKYYELMRNSYLHNREHWMEILNKDEVTFLCYCTDPSKCHRTLLSEMFIKVGKSLNHKVVYLGEKNK